MWPPARWATTPGCPYNFVTLLSTILLVREGNFPLLFYYKHRRVGFEYKKRGGGTDFESSLPGSKKSKRAKLGDDDHDLGGIQEIEVFGEIPNPAGVIVGDHQVFIVRPGHSDGFDDQRIPGHPLVGLGLV